MKHTEGGKEDMSDVPSIGAETGETLWSNSI